MKTYLKRLLIPILSGLIVCSFYSCDSDDEHTATLYSSAASDVYKRQSPVRLRKSTDSVLQKKI